MSATPTPNTWQRRGLRQDEVEGEIFSTNLISLEKTLILAALKKCHGLQGFPLLPQGRGQLQALRFNSLILEPVQLIQHLSLTPFPVQEAWSGNYARSSAGVSGCRLG